MFQKIVSPVLMLACCSFAIAQDSAATKSKDAAFDDDSIKFFEEKVQPILEKSCLECHGKDPDELGGSLALISRAAILKGGDSGPAIDLEDHSGSLLLEAVNYEFYEMPPSGKLPQAEIDILTKWVKMGAPWTAASADKVVESNHMEPEVNEQSKQFWSFQKVERPVVPTVKNEQWITNEIDNFILARLESKGLAPAKEASKQSLIRRVYYDLIGLPPTPEEVRAFVADDSPDAYRQLVERLLASPHYGEKWGRHWLDLVRYAESNSFERDGTKPYVWRYRDYVIRAFNNDKPYDRFLIEQLAGDELPDAGAEQIIATGYYRLGQWDDEPADPTLAMYDDLDDILATTSQAMMGLTVNCARCHNHKIDPIRTQDYYSMLAFFRNVRRYGVRAHETVLDASTRQVERDIKPDPEEVAEYNRKLERVEQRIKEIEDIVKKDFEPVEHEDFQYDKNRERLVGKRVESKVITKKQFENYRRQRGSRKQLIDNPPTMYRVLCVNEHDTTPPQTHVMIRGNAHAKGEPVDPAFISVLSPPEPEISPVPGNNSSGRRLALAKWIASPGHPLTSRVMVNRIWQHHFGRGIVRTTNDFGFQGAKPTHPDLLDYLSTEFVDGGWSVKNMHRLIMNSRTYKMAYVKNENAAAVDPLNDLLWRFDMRRLTAEEIRDSILAVSGRLNKKKMYGESVFVKLSQEVLEGQSMPGAGWGKSSVEDQLRRSIYIHVKRSLQVPLLAAFDVADTDTTCPVRFNTTQPTQALHLLNSEFTNDEAEEFAKVIKGQFETTKERVREILTRVTQREPNSAEVSQGLELIEQWQKQDGLSDDQALKYFCLVAFNLNEFIFVD